MEEELNALLMMLSTDLHELEARFPDEDLPHEIDKVWMIITRYLHNNDITKTR